MNCHVQLALRASGQKSKVTPLQSTILRGLIPTAKILNRARKQWGRQIINTMTQTPKVQNQTEIVYRIHVHLFIKGIPNGFLRRIAYDPCTRDAARLSESVKILEPQASVFLCFPKVEQHPKCMDHAILLGKPFGNCFIK